MTDKEKIITTEDDFAKLREENAQLQKDLAKAEDKAADDVAAVKAKLEEVFTLKLTEDNIEEFMKIMKACRNILKVSLVMKVKQLVKAEHTKLFSCSMDESKSDICKTKVSNCVEKFKLSDEVPREFVSNELVSSELAIHCYQENWPDRASGPDYSRRCAVISLGDCVTVEDKVAKIGGRNIFYLEHEDLFAY